MVGVITAADAAASRTALGVDASGTDNSTAVTLANTNYLTISGQEITGGTVPIASGGTGATSASAALTALGAQASDAELAAVAGLTSAADKGIQFTGSGSAATYDLTAAGKALLDDANAAAQLVTLGVTSTAAELNLLDGGTPVGSSITIANTDGFIINDGTAMKTIPASDLKTYVGSTTSINDLTDGKANDTNFSNSILIGQSTTGTLDNAQYNVGIGYGVFDALTSGDRNMGVGYNALNRVTQGSGNIAIGGQSLTALTTGNRNVAIGRQSGRDVDDGQLSGGADLTIGEENTYIGAWTQPSASNVSNETVIGSEATGKGANTVVIGNPQVTQVYASEDAGATLFAAGLNLGGQSLTSTAAELNILDASASNSVSSDGASSNGNFTSNNYKISHTFTIDGNLADGAVTNDITITNNKVLATSVIITNASINVNIDVHTVVTGSFKVRITNKSGAQLNDNSTIIINYIVL